MLKPILLVEDDPRDLELTLVALERSHVADRLVAPVAIAGVGVVAGAVQPLLDSLHVRAKVPELDGAC